MVSASPVLLKPSPAAGSTGNDFAGRMSMPVRSRIALSYSALLRRRGGTTPGSPDSLRDSVRITCSSVFKTSARAAADGCFAFAGGISSFFRKVTTSSHCRKSSSIVADDVKRARFNSPLFFLALWQPNAVGVQERQDRVLIGIGRPHSPSR